ncbi:MAG: YlxR family protein [Clostridiales bacterium]
MRMCVGCNEMKVKKELIRIVKNSEDDIFLDTTGKKHGRGAYLCKSLECLDIARKNKKFEKAFQTKIDSDIFEVLIEQLEDMNE